MAKLIYITNASVDGYVEDASGSFAWSTPDEEYHAFINELIRPIGTFLYGRRMYETMVYWESLPLDDDVPPVIADFTTIWRGADKIVYSSTLTSPTSARTRIESRFEPDEIRRLKDESDKDLTVGGADLAGQAIRAGLVDELQLFSFPVVVGGGKPRLPAGHRFDVELIDSQRFAGGVVFSRYRPR